MNPAILTAIVSTLALWLGYLLGWNERGKWDRAQMEMDARLRQVTYTPNDTVLEAESLVDAAFRFADAHPEEWDESTCDLDD
jgi:hypothetical protein